MFVYTYIYMFVYIYIYIYIYIMKQKNEKLFNSRNLHIIHSTYEGFYC